MNPTAIHEASHCAAAWLLGRRVDYCWRTLGSSLPGETLGHSRIPIGERLEPSQLVIALIGYMSVEAPGWPPSFREACDEELEGLWIIMFRLQADEERYRKTVEFTRELLADPDFIRLRDSIARALEAVPYIHGETIEELARIGGLVPESEGAVTCST